MIIANMTTMTRTEHYKGSALYGVIVSVYHIAIKNGGTYFIEVCRSKVGKVYYAFLIRP